ncbi:cation:proton antiporter [Candidatus Hodarchaeum mangrovi]
MFLSKIDEIQLLIPIFEIGIVIIFSLVLARVLGKRGIPQVLGLIFAGIGLQFLAKNIGFPTPPTAELHYIITNGALGFIGFSIGAHLDLRKFREESIGLTLVLVGEAFGAFIIVIFAIGFFLGDWILAFLLGSIAMATAPASTSAVISEYRSEGPLSQLILFIIAFDDILAIIFFNVFLNYSKSYFLGISLSLLETILPIILELAGSLILGIFLALLLYPFHFEGVSASQSAEFVFPAILICIALAGLLDISIILSCVIFGLTLSTVARCENKACIMGVERLSSPIIALFFILIGFEMDLSQLITNTLLLIMIYVFARATGKFIGSYTTARLAKMPENVLKNLPISLLTQAGVAVGLAALAYSQLLEIGIPSAIITAVLLLDVIAVSVLITEIIGPLLLKFALKRANEVNVTKSVENVDSGCDSD